jgi:hypothetical protein
MAKNPAVQKGLYPLNGCSKPKKQTYKKEKIVEPKHPSSAIPKVPTFNQHKIPLPGRRAATPPIYRGIMGGKPPKKFK